MIHALFFWAHVGVIALSITAGLFISFQLVALCILLHRLHLVLFGGCIFTIAKQKFNVMPKHMDFFQYASEKLFKKALSANHSKLLEYSIISATFLIALTKSVIL